MANITLIHPPTVFTMHLLSHTDSIPPIGLAYISAAAKAAGHQVTVIDGPGEAINSFHSIQGSSFNDLFIHGLTPEEILDRIDPNSDLIGISHMHLHMWPLLRDLARQIKQRYPDKILMFGGETPSSFWEQMMKETPYIDYIIVGEGEITFVDFLEALDTGAPVEEIPAVVYRDDTGTAVKTEGKRARIREVDEIEAPDWEAFQVDAYLDQDYNYSSGVDRGRSMPLLPTRGCPYQCTFCSAPEMWTTRYVVRDPKQVADEIERYIERYNVENIDFVDLTAVVKRRWAIEFTDELIKRDLNITWQLPSGTRSEALDREVLEGLYKSGCRNLTYAPESGSPRLLKEVKKQVKLDSLTASMKEAVDIGLVAHANMILGLPGERWSDIWLSYKYTLKLAVSGLNSFAVMIFAPYPGSALFKQLVDEGKIEYNDDYYYSALLRAGKAPISYNDGFSAKLLVRLQMIFLLSFWSLHYLARPQRLVKTFFRLFTTRREESIMDRFLNAKKFYAQKKKQMGAPVVLGELAESAPGLVNGTNGAAHPLDPLPAHRPAARVAAARAAARASVG